LGQKHKLRVFENRVLQKIFGPKRDEVTGEWRRLRNEEYYDVYVSPSGACGGAVVEALSYKPEGRGIDPRWCHWNFSLT
jgi:hypothetical protein